MIDIQSVSKRYGALDALKEISLFIEKGDIFGIIGLSGAGKSTLIRTLARLIRPTSGKILVEGIDITQLEGKALRAYRHQMGMIFQNFNLLSSCSVADNISYPLEIAGISKEKREQRIDELLALVGLSDKKEIYPSMLSGGQKQRVGIARALASHPKILLCDEATSALDPKTTREILDLLHSISKKLGVTIVLITHEMEVIRRLCNKVAVIEKGSIVEQGLVTEVFSNPQHPTTQQFLQNSSHDLSPEFIKTLSLDGQLLRLHFRGQSAKEPIISHMMRHFKLEVNILMGWIDRVQHTTVGTLIVELKGSDEAMEKAKQYLLEQNVKCEVLNR